MKRFAALTLAIFALLAPAVAGAAFARTGTPSVVFTAAGPAGLKIEGKTSELDVKEDQGEVKVTVPLAQLDTGITLRNKHMREKYLETGKYPVAELVVTRATLQLPVDGASSTGTSGGQLTLHGQTRPVTVKYSIKRVGAGYDVEGGLHVNMNDYGVSVPSYLGVTVRPDVDIVVKFAASDL